MRSARWCLPYVVLAAVAFAAAQDAPEQPAEGPPAAVVAAFDAADAALNAAYDRAREAMPSHAFAHLRLDQRQWLEARDPAAEAYAELLNGLAVEDLRATPDFYEYRTLLTEDRTDLLAGIVSYYEDPAASTWDGFWVDGNGGHLALRELEDGRLRFQLTVVRSPALHTGWLEGVAQRNGELASFETAFETGEREESVWLFLVRDGPYLRVHTANAGYFAGARAYFDGAYARLRDLEPFDLD